MEELTEKKCVPCEGYVPPLLPEKINQLLQQLEGWEISSNAKEISRDFQFKNFYHTMAFVNAVAWIANQEGHHPDMEVGYNHCKINFTTHAIKGLTENDFICAAKVNALQKK